MNLLGADPLFTIGLLSAVFTTSTAKYFLLAPECREVVKIFQVLPFKYLFSVEESPNPNMSRSKQKSKCLGLGDYQWK